MRCSMLRSYRLHRIVSVILKDIYSIRPMPISRQCSLAANCSQMLEQWRDTIPHFLFTNHQESITMIPIFQRQRDVLNISYWHALVLLNRPILLRKFALMQGGRYDHIDHTEVETRVNECLVAALHVIKQVEEMFQSKAMFRCFWVSSTVPDSSSTTQS